MVSRFHKPLPMRLLQSLAMVVCAVIVVFHSPVAAYDYLTNATNANQNSLGQALNNIAPSATGGLLSMTNSLAAESPTQQQQSLNELSGQLFGSTQTIGIQVGDQFQQRIGARLINTPRFMTGGLTSESVGGSDSALVPTVTSNNLWLQGYGVGGSLYGDGNGAGVRYSQGGGFYGYDLGSDDTGCFGIAGGNSYVGFDDGFGGYGNLNTTQVGLYGMKHNDVGYVLGTANYGYNYFGTTRSVMVGATGQSLSANFSGQQFGFYVESGLKFHTAWFHLQPLIGVQYNYFSQQSFSENGGAAALDVSGAQANSFRTHLGGRLAVHELVSPGGIVWTPYWQLRWVSELLNRDHSVDASFVGSPPNGSFTSHGTQLGQNYLMIGKGLQVQISDQWSAFGNIDVMMDGHIRTEMLSVGALFAF